MTPPDDRSLADTLDGAREPQPGDDEGVPVAATVVVLRETQDGAETLLLRRPDRGSFGGAWVFPGGKLEPGDHDGVDAGDEEAVARRAGIRETQEETGLALDAAEMVTLSRWNPPPGIALRIRTWFFVAPDPGGDLVPAPEEVAEAAWIPPAEALARHGRGELSLYPPTWLTLHHLAGIGRPAAVRDEARVAGIRRFDTVARRDTAGPVLLWQGDAEYDADAPHAASGARHRLEIGALPWIYTRTL
ncbi:hypothetical protein GCM10022200_11600 [Microbacterium awajiense]|uniref:Nudix hydrolase domain-containing protein n=1 Tax=Microbacterium awajiense TaxID=415214 RepID=A0ABP7AF41_9MICO